MALPKMVQEANKKADEAHQKAYGKEEPQEPQVNTEDKAGQDPVEEGQDVKEVAAPTPDTQAGSDETPKEADKDDVFKHKFEVLQGKYDAEVPRLYQQLDQLRMQNQQLSSLMQTQQAAKPDTEDQKGAETMGATPAEIEDYGQDFIDFVRRVAREEVVAKSQELEGYVRNVDARVNSVGESVQLSAKERFIAKLTEAVPDWEKWNVDQGFLDWLAGADEVTGYARKPAFDDAASKYEVGRIIRMFNAYKESVGVSTAPKTDDRKSRKQRELERQVTPQTKGSSSVPAREDKKTYSPLDIKSFYEDVRNGRYKGRDDERLRLEHDIMLAQREGRITA